ncbi:MAG: hypothetical protein IID31_00820 [Planctomycetes bacterium]|nr:hypothetical protein [Planctomycetota bacterium]
MPERLFQLYQQRRIVNINVNIVFAGLLAMGLTLFPVHLTRRFGIDAEIAITLITIVFDMTFDVVIYYALHWMANHWRPFRLRRDRPSPPRRHRAFFADATLVQFERVLLAPLYYAISGGLQFTLLKLDVERELAFVMGVLVGITVTRVIHTLWGLRSGTFVDHDESRADGSEPDSQGPDDA